MFFHTFGVASLPKDSGLPDNFLPELLASAKDFFYGGFISPFPRFLPSSPCIPYLSALLFTLHFPLLSLPSPTMASTLHTATAFWLLLPCDFLPFVSTLRSLIYASQEGQTHLLDTHFISCCWKTITDLLH